MKADMLSGPRNCTEVFTWQKKGIPLLQEKRLPITTRICAHYTKHIVYTQFLYGASFVSHFHKKNLSQNTYGCVELHTHVRFLQSNHALPMFKSKWL